MSWIKNFLLKFALIIGSSIIGLVLFEIFLEFETRYKPVQRVMVNIHGQIYPFLKIESTASPLQISPNSRDFLVLGDSFTEGLVCAQDNANFPSHLSKMISSKIKVVNLGLGATNNANYVDYLDHFNISEGDVALVTLYDNDIYITQRQCRQIRRQAKDYNIYVPRFCSKDEFYLDKSDLGLLKQINNRILKYKTVQLVKETAVQIPLLQKYFYRHEYRNVWNDFDAEENKWLRSSLQVMQQQMNRNGGSAVFAYYPNTNKISDNDVRHKIWTRFIEYVKENEGIDILDPYPHFVKYAPQKSMVWSLTDKHPNCAAHKIMADFLINNVIIKSKFATNDND